MGIKAVLRYFNHGNGNVGAVVRNALIVGQQIIQHKTVLNGAGAGLQAGNMAGFDFAHQAVHNLLQRLDLFCEVIMVAVKSLYGHLRDVHDSLFDDIHFGFGVRRKLNLIHSDRLCRFHDIDRMVTDPFKVRICLH